MNLLAVKNLYVRVENKIVVENVSFELGASDRLSILGPNGAGKSMLLKALLDLVPHSGEIIWDPAVKIGYVPQKIDADRHLPLTYRDLFISKCRISNVSVGQIDEISRNVGLSKEMLETPVGHLSGGYFQRGLIGFALIGRPNVLLLNQVRGIFTN
jgi:zinc transport system ATP-binding protein